MKRSCGFIFLILLVVMIYDLGFAQTSKSAKPIKPSNSVNKTRPDAPAISVFTAAQSLEQDLYPALKALTKDIQLYHYFEAPLDESSTEEEKKIHSFLNEKAGRDEWINDVIRARSGNFWNQSYRTIGFNNAGPGLYLAIDPSASKEYGNTALVLNVRKDTPYFAVAKPIALSKITLELLVKEKIIAATQVGRNEKTLRLGDGFTSDALKFMVRPENKKFREIVTNFFKKNKISFIEYLYQSHLAGFCKIGNQSSFVFISEPIVSENTPPTEQPLAADSFAFVQPQYLNPVLVSEYEINNQTQEEKILSDLVKKFTTTLQAIRVVGTGQAASNLIYENLNENEVNQLVELSYKCEKKY